MSESVLVVSAHPDDEILGCGGVMAKHIIQGDEVNVIILCEGITSRSNVSNIKNNQKKLKELKKSAINANKCLGVGTLEFIGLPDNRLDSIDLLEVVKIIEKYIDYFKPSRIYTHNNGDLNIDHQITHKAALTAARPYPNQTVKDIYSFEIPSSTGWSSDGENRTFVPNIFVDITETLNKKLEALRFYSSEMRDWPHSRSYKSVEYLARYRGATVGIEACEAFMLHRKLVK